MTRLVIRMIRPHQKTKEKFTTLITLDLGLAIQEQCMIILHITPIVVIVLRMIITTITHLERMNIVEDPTVMEVAVVATDNLRTLDTKPWKSISHSSTN